MSPEKQRIAIGWACGFVFCGRYFMSDQYDDYLAKHGPGVAVPHDNGSVMGQWPSTGSWCKLPDYLENLNAIQEAIMYQQWDDSEEIDFYQNLQKVVGANDPFGEVTATAAERCKALLLTLGKWKP
jgi:hypothetical protein